MLLADIIKQKITDEGPVSFRDFMEMALYYPGLGYYTSAGEKIGRNGDYYTSATLTPLFGEMIAKQLEEMWRILGKKPFTIVEYGAGTGALGLAIMNELKNNAELYEKMHYCIIEKSPAMREKEREILHEKVNWCDSLREIPWIDCVLSNEVVDNFPVHRVVMGDELMEVFVDFENDFKEVLQPASHKLKAYFSELEVELPKGYTTEVNLQATGWMREIATALNKGFVMTVDYGFPTAELYRVHRQKGTLVCYNRHHVNAQPYQNIGEQDITTHINFSALNHWGKKYGLNCSGFTNQAYFLLSLGFAQHLKEKENRGEATYADSPEKVLLLHRLLTDMGSKFKILIQQKGVEGGFLSGLKFGQRIN